MIIFPVRVLFIFSLIVGWLLFENINYSFSEESQSHLKNNNKMEGAVVLEMWNKIKNWANQNAPDILTDLNKGASDSEVNELESLLNIKLPSDFVASLKIHNGESDGWPCKFFADYGAYLGTDRIVSEWNQRLKIVKDMSEDFDSEEAKEKIKEGIIFVEGPVVPKFFLKKWVPIMESNGDVFWALDLSPAEGGTKGQIIEVDWENCSWRVIASSFSQFLSSYANSLTLGEYKVVNGVPLRDL